MSTTVFDTLAYAKRLKAAGVPEAQAEAQAEALAAAISSEIVTRRDLQIELAPIRSDIQIMKWMLGFNLALSVTILFKIFT
jgi:hypothetical protein